MVSFVLIRFKERGPSKLPSFMVLLASVKDISGVSICLLCVCASHDLLSLERAVYITHYILLQSQTSSTTVEERL